MSPNQNFKSFLTRSIMNMEYQLSLFKELLRSYDSVAEKDSVAQSVINARFQEATLSPEEETVLSFIRSKGPVSKSDLTTRFARKLDANELYGSDGVVRKLLLKRLVTSHEDRTESRMKVFYKAAPYELKGFESGGIVEGSMDDRVPSFIMPGQIDTSSVIDEKLMAVLDNMALNPTLPGDDERVKEVLDTLTSGQGNGGAGGSIFRDFIFNDSSLGSSTHNDLPEGMVPLEDEGEVGMCDVCRRKTWNVHDLGIRCGMPQPGIDLSCQGHFARRIYE